MKFSRRGWRVLLGLLVAGVVSTSAQDNYPKLSPFQGLRWVSAAEGPRAEVLLQGRWMELVSLEKFPTSRILEFCEQTWPESSQKRFGEDLVEVMAKMGHALGETVHVQVRDLETGELETHPAVRLTRANRQAVWRLNSTKPGAVGEAILGGRFPKDRTRLPPPADVADPRYVFLRQLPSARTSEALDVEAARRDLIQLEELMVERFSYLTLTGVDRRAAFDALHLGVMAQGAQLSRSQFALGVRLLMTLFGDGHSSGPSLRSHALRGFTPFLVEESANGLVAFREDRSALLRPSHPLLVAIDGVDIEDWLDSAKFFGPRGSEASERWWAVGNLRYIAQLRALRGVPSSERMEVTLADVEGGRKSIEMMLRTDNAPRYGEWPADKDRVLQSNVGYLRISSMASEQSEIDRWNKRMTEFRDTRALVIDLRDNGGGSRVALRTLLPYFLEPGGDPLVVNVAALRVADDATPRSSMNLLEDRFLFQSTAPNWSATELQAIRRVEQGFLPDWEMPMGFSPWHFMVVNKATNPLAYSYKQPVLLLVNTGCFSATDVFLGAFAQLPAVRLIGTPSGGGSGRSRRYQLQESGLTVRLSSMASFRPNGTRYDGKGVEVDVLVRPDVGDMLGHGDAVLEAALAQLDAPPPADGG